MNRIRELRVSKGWTQTELAMKMNTVKSVISRYELEQHGMDVDIISALCDIFGCTADYLLCRSDVPYSAVSEEDARLISAYHALPLEIRRAVDGLLAPYVEVAKKKNAG